MSEREDAHSRQCTHDELILRRFARTESRRLVPLLFRLDAIYELGVDLAAEDDTGALSDHLLNLAAEEAAALRVGSA